MKLIINADDFGLTDGVNRGILKGMQDGLLTDTSAIVCAPAFASGAELALQNGVREMGLHCLATVGRPILPAGQVRSLVGENGVFYSRDVFMSRDIDVSELEAEMEAQIGVLLRSGLALSHLDTHHGFMYKTEAIKEMFVRLAHKYDVPLRNEQSRKTDEGPVNEELRRLGVRAVEKLYFNRGIPCHTVETVKAFLEEAQGRWDMVEIGCHPGYSDEELRNISPLNDDREKELAVFLDPSLRQYVEGRVIERISYSQWHKTRNRAS